MSSKPKTMKKFNEKQKKKMIWLHPWYSINVPNKVEKLILKLINALFPPKSFMIK